MWKKKLREYKGKYENYSIRKKLNNEKRINSNFETILNSLNVRRNHCFEIRTSSISC